MSAEITGDRAVQRWSSAHAWRSTTFRQFPARDGPRYTHPKQSAPRSRARAHQMGISRFASISPGLDGLRPSTSKHLHFNPTRTTFAPKLHNFTPILILLFRILLFTILLLIPVAFQPLTLQDISTFTSDQPIVFFFERILVFS